MRGLRLLTTIVSTSIFCLRNCIAFLQHSLPTDSKAANTIQVLGISSIEDAIVAPPKESSPLTVLDPLISRLLLNDDDEEELDYASVLTASQELTVWRSALLKGRLPIDSEFDTLWPEEPLFAQTHAAMANLQFPRFVLKHPETVNAVLRTILRMATQFSREMKGMEEALEESDADDEEDDDDDYYDWDILEDRWTTYEEVDEEDHSAEEESIEEFSLSDEEKQQLASEIVADGLTQQWTGVIGGVQALDQLFGADHGLLDVVDNGSSLGFGVEDGVWSHSGWKLLPSLQREIAAMPELRALIQELGRRPTAEQSDAIHKFVPRRLDPEGALGAQHDPSQRASVEGITLSGSLSEMLPSEAMLLVDRCNKNVKEGKVKSNPLRRLFLAKMAESKLLSYESSGWQDVPSRTVDMPRYLSRLPSAPGGPIMICLDTSWSMTGRREQLSKAVVLACVAAAHKQKRDIQVVAFSSARNTIETGPITADVEGVQRLLEFLSSSFGGGTDVTGALKHAMTTVSSTAEHTESTNEASESPSRMRTDFINSMASADILLVTDGEIPDPPVSDEIMEALERLKQRAGVQIHGLLVGKQESIPLAKLCNRIHDFLIGYEGMLPTNGATVSPSRSRVAVQAKATGDAPDRLGKLRTRWGWKNNIHPSISDGHRNRFWRLPAKLSDYDDDDGVWGGGGGKRRNRGGGKKNRYSSHGDDPIDVDEYEESSNNNPPTQTAASDNFSTQSQEAVQSIQIAVAEQLSAQEWQPSSLDEEKHADGSCWRYRAELQKAVERVAEGLVEREEEARLVVLGMVSEEHVLFLGPPGTAKSVLGRRLSQLCGGTFFQRLLTKFTTPEEIFGPLSLQALENDEYRRKTDGFLPTATVAFLDEIFKANSAILNTLLTILNERQFDNGAGLREDCPIKCVIAASNELPESDELAALYDRFLLRKEVMPVSDDGIMKMLGLSFPGKSLCDDETMQMEDGCDGVFTDDLDTLIKAISRAADSVVMDAEACSLMRDLRTFLREDMDVDVSDRRLVKASHILSVSAACHGRTKVDPLDCLLLQHMVWRLPEERSAVREWLWNHVTPGSSSLTTATLEDESLESAAASSVRQYRVLLDGLRQDSIAAVRKTSGDVTGEGGGRQVDIEVIQSLSEEAARIGEILEGRSAELGRHLELLRRAADHLWLDPDEAQAAQQLLLPRAEAFLKATMQALQDARALEISMSADEGLANDLRQTVIELLWDEEGDAGISFSGEALNMSMRDAKAKYDLETFRAWKRARKKSGV